MRKKQETQALLLFVCCCTLLAGITPVQADNTEATVRLFLAEQPRSKAALTRALWNAPIPTKHIKHRSYLDLRRLRNAIFAVKGARFRSSDLQNFYAKQRWYRPSRPASRIRLSRWAKHNLKTLLKFEGIAKVKKLAALKKSLWGPIQKIVIKGALFCFDTGTYRVLQAPDSIWIAYSGRGGTCDIHPQKVVFKMKRSSAMDLDFRGISGAYAFLWRTTGSDYKDLQIISLHTQKAVNSKYNTLPPGDDTRYHPASKGLSFYISLKQPASCETKDFTKRYLALKACWPDIQKKYPILKNKPFPKCPCTNPRGLTPFILARALWSPKHPAAAPKLLGPVSCGCSS